MLDERYAENRSEIVAGAYQEPCKNWVGCFSNQGCTTFSVVTSHAAYCWRCKKQKVSRNVFPSRLFTSVYRCVNKSRFEQSVIHTTFNGI